MYHGKEKRGIKSAKAVKTKKFFNKIKPVDFTKKLLCLFCIKY